MHPEYDFSRAVRGRHRDRFGIVEPDAAPGWYQEAVLFDRQSWLGEALGQVQRLEALLVTYLSLVFGVAPEQAGRSVVAGVDASNGDLPRILTDLRSRAKGSGRDLEAGLANALRDRDWLIHKSLQQHDATDISSTRDLVLRLQAVTRSVAAACDETQQVMKVRLRDAGMTEEEYERRSNEVLQRWLAA